MEDHHVVKTHYAYQVRLDLSHNSISECLIEKWLDKFHASEFLFGREFKPESNIPHFQGIVWFESRLTDAKMTMARNWWRNKTILTHGPSGRKCQGHSFTSARKIRNLGKYCQKDGNYWNSLSSHQMEQIGKWKTIDALKLEKSEKLAKMVKKHVVTPMNFHQFLKIFDEIYWEVYDTNPHT